MRVLGKAGAGLSVLAVLVLSVGAADAAEPVSGELVIDGKVILSAPPKGTCMQVTVLEGMTVTNRTAQLAYFFPDAECRLAEPCMVAPSQTGRAHANGRAVLFLDDRQTG